MHVEFALAEGKSVKPFCKKKKKKNLDRRRFEPLTSWSVAHRPNQLRHFLVMQISNYRFTKKQSVVLHLGTLRRTRTCPDSFGNAAGCMY